MDPLTFAVYMALGGLFMLNRLATGIANKKKAGGNAGNSHEPPEERMGSGGVGQPRDDAADKARRVPEQHLPISDAGRATAPPAATPPTAPDDDVAVLQLVRDRRTGRFHKKAA